MLCAVWTLLKLLDVIDLMHRVPKQQSQQHTNLFGSRDGSPGRQFFHGLGVKEMVYEMIKVHFIYCALYFISSMMLPLIW